MVPEKCIYCKSTKVIFVQYRKNLSGDKPIYLYKSCQRKFTPGEYKNYRFSPVIIKTALKLLEEGASLSQVKGYIRDNFKIKITRKTVLDWKRKFGLDI